MTRAHFAFVTHVCQPGKPLERGIFMSTYTMSGALWVVIFHDGTTKRMPAERFAREGWWRTNDNGRTWVNTKGEIIA